MLKHVGRTTNLIGGKVWSILRSSEMSWTPNSQQSRQAYNSSSVNAYSNMYIVRWRKKAIDLGIFLTAA
jgi:hypothetical protein